VFEKDSRYERTEKKVKVSLGHGSFKNEKNQTHPYQALASLKTYIYLTQVDLNLK